jgi:hypothetical protein
LVFVLDDIHSIDPDSIGIIRTLLLDPTNIGEFFVVAASRPIVQYPHIQKLLEDVPQIRTMKLPELSFNGTSLLLTSLFGTIQHESQLEALTKIIHDKTEGNAFMIIHFIRMLEQRKLLSYEENGWSWNIEEIAADTLDKKDVIEIVVQNLLPMDRKMKSALIVAAAFGVSGFAVSTIVHAIPFLDGTDPSAVQADCIEDLTDPYIVRQNTVTMNAQLEQAASEGFLVQTDPGHFKFAHDRIRESALTLLPDGDARRELHLRIGRQLRLYMDMQTELGFSAALNDELLLLNATRQLNAGCSLIKDHWELVDLAELNLRSAELAAKQLSFTVAMEFLVLGIRHLGSDPWASSYSLIRKMKVALMRIQFNLKLFQDSLTTAEDIIANSKSFDDQRPAHHAKISCLVRLEKQGQALESCLAVFELLGDPFPKRCLMARAFMSLIKTRRLMRKLSDEEILDVQIHEDQRHEDLLDFLDKLVDIVYIGKKNDEFLPYLLLAATKYVRAAREGTFELRAIALSFLSWVECRLGEYHVGFRFGKLSLRLSELGHYRCKTLAYRTSEIHWYTVYHWQAPLRNGLCPLKLVTSKMWDKGCYDRFHFGMPYLLQYMFFCGEPLTDIAAECSTFFESSQDYQQSFHWSSAAPIFQAVLNLMNPALQNPGELVGNVVKSNDYVSWVKASNFTAEFRYQLFAMILSYHFDGIEAAKTFMDQMNPDIWFAGPSLTVIFRVFYSGLVYQALFRQKKLYKYRRKAFLSIQRLRRWVGKGNVNCMYMLLLLQAQDKALTGVASEKVMSAFDESIAEATKLGLCNQIALANELASQFLFSQRSPKWTSYHESAIMYYHQWGAHAKVRELKEKREGKESYRGFHYLSDASFTVRSSISRSFVYQGTRDVVSALTSEPIKEKDASSS